MTAILLADPKYPHNVGGAVRAASCFGATEVLFTGQRLKAQLETLSRLPREERMKGYREVTWRHSERPFDEMPTHTPVCVEVDSTAEKLPFFEHPENPLYCFGPEDGSVPTMFRHHCHRFVTIPARHCTNLASAIYVVLYDKLMKDMVSGRSMGYEMVDVGWAEHADFLT